MRMNLNKYRKRSQYGADKLNKVNNFEFLNLNYCKKGQNVLAGDSITEMYTHTEMFGGYTERTGIEVYNRGISGDTSDRLLERFESTVLNLEPRNISVLIGTNDMAIGASAEYIVENVEKIVELSKRKCGGTNIIIQSVYPINNRINPQGKRNNKTVAVINTGLKEIAERKGVSFLDLTQCLEDENGMLNPKYTYDGLHVNAFAYEVITEKMLPLLK